MSVLRRARMVVREIETELLTKDMRGRLESMANNAIKRILARLHLRCTGMISHGDGTTDFLLEVAE